MEKELGEFWLFVCHEFIGGESIISTPVGQGRALDFHHQNF
jgi:hypothetical protein